mmetsp:Transcript_8965/g.20978  ORF Transcript_8965/g.20978 Transcript_8965/m.20978 type:complete len:188 (+) Transcript_8965:3-566(+)
MGHLTAASTRLSVRCPIGLGPIGIPVRGRGCTHLQCFDLVTFLQMNKNYGVARWRCGVCSKTLNVAELEVDTFIFSIMKQLQADSAAEGREAQVDSDGEDTVPEEIEIHPNGQWHVPPRRQKRQRQRQRQRSPGGAKGSDSSTDGGGGAADSAVATIDLVSSDEEAASARGGGSGGAKRKRAASSGQ